VADGDLASPIPDNGGEEVARLAGAVRRMRATLLEKLRELDAERSLLSSVISGMHEGLLVVGPDRRIRLANAEVRRVLELNFDPTGHLLAEAVREPTVNADVERALEQRREVRESIVRPSGGRAFELHVNPFGTEGDEGVLVLLFEITRLEALEGVRRQFVANVSHELRTPLTAIRAFVENLLDGGLDDSENAVKFVEIIRKHADRMGALIEDLTDLSLIETGSIRLDLRPVRAADVVQEVVEQLRPIAADRGVSFEVEVPADLVVTADRRRFEQTLTNLIDNAIKFNRKGGYVKIRGLREPLPTIAVEDDGIGISREAQEKIFNRFFQVDQARSRASGGTGLGLAIVKHLMRLQGGRVRLESELGSGATFLLEFPAEPA
jgi:two-component system phosphate regulon sensor histidine kinase PhoR